MRTLSRPMFNMGGPIKEGVMHGIREPYKGGQLVRPGPGRPGYQGEINPQAWHRKPLKKIVDTTKSTADAVKKANLFKKASSLFSKGIPTDVQIGKGIKKAWRGLGKWKLPGLGVTNPLTFGLPAALSAKAAFTDVTPIEKEYGITKGDWRPWKGKVVASSLPGTGGEYLPLAIQNLIGERKIEEPKTILENITMEEGVPGGGDPRMTYTDPDKASKLAKQRRDDRVNELLKIMGHDQSKKDAVYNALIDASQIVTAAPGGGTLDITKEIISPVIAATSKRFDKPKEIEEAVRLMQTKADIQKDLTKDETALSNEALRLKIKVSKKTLAGATLSESILATTLKEGAPTGEKLAGMARATLKEDFKVLPLKVPKKTDTLEHLTDVVKESHINPDKDPFPAGNYVLKERVIYIDEQGNVTPLDIT